MSIVHRNVSSCFCRSEYMYRKNITFKKKLTPIYNTPGEWQILMTKYDKIKIKLPRSLFFVNQILYELFLQTHSSPCHSSVCVHTHMHIIMYNFSLITHLQPRYPHTIVHVSHFFVTHFKTPAVLQKPGFNCKNQPSSDCTPQWNSTTSQGHCF